MFNIVCFGDTNTWGYDNRSGNRLPYTERWTGILSELLGPEFHIIEEGQPGRATRDDPVESGKMQENTLFHVWRVMIQLMYL